MIHLTRRGVVVSCDGHFYTLTPWTEPCVMLPTGMRRLSLWPRRVRELP